MSPNSPRRPSQSAEMLVGAFLTAVAHVGVIGLMFFAFAPGSGDDVTDALPVLELELLRWGEAMPDPTALPEIANPTEAPDEAQPPDPEEAPPEEEAQADPDEVVLNPIPTEQPPEERETEAVPEREQTESTQVVDRGETIQQRPTNTVPIPGSPSGLIGGTSFSDSVLARQLATIIRQIQQAVHRPETITQDLWTQYWARVHIRMDDDGRITRMTFVDPSGNRQFDSAVRYGLNRFGEGSQRLTMSSVTNAQLREVLVEQGLIIVIAPR